MAKQLDPLSMFAQLMRVPQPSALEQAREREREKEKVRRSRAEYRKKNRERMRILRSKS